jgi:hypothetical protein
VGPGVLVIVGEIGKRKKEFSQKVAKKGKVEVEQLGPCQRGG